MPSPQVATYDQKPEMSAREVANRLAEALATGEYEFLVANFANTDMVGHTGNLPAAIRAVEVVDECLGVITDAAATRGGTVLITSDHGNAEQMEDNISRDSHTAHTTNKVPFVVIGKDDLSVVDGKLSDIAPTILHIMGSSIPEEMTGTVLVNKLA